MIIKQHLVPVNATVKGVNLYPVSDLHIGSENFLEDRFNEWKGRVLDDKEALVVIAGDIIDEDRPTTRLARKVMYHDRIEAFRAEDNQHLYYLDREVIPRLKFLNKLNCLGAIDGDHFRQYSNGLSSTQYICAKLGIPYLGSGQAIISLKFTDKQKPRTNYNVHIRHGQGFNSKQGGTLNRNIDFSKKIAGVDAFIRGHSHNCLVNSEPFYEFDGRELSLTDRECWLVNCGSFRGGISQKFTDYAEHAEYGNTNKRQALLSVRLKRSCGYYHAEAEGHYI